MPCGEQEEHMGRKVWTTAPSALVVAAIPVCLRCAEASVRACGENQPAPAPHVCSPPPLPSPPLPHSPRRWRRGRWGGLGVKTVRVFSHMQRLVLLCQPTKCGSGGRRGAWLGAFMRVLGGVKGEAEAPACLSRKSGSCHFCVYRTPFFAHFLSSP